MADRTSGIDPADVERVRELAEAARTASRRLALMSRAEKDAALRTLADDLEAATDEVVEANERDLARGREHGMPDSLQDRLRLDPPRLAAVAQALRDIAALPDPVGEVVRGSTLANGLQIRQVRVPMGVIGMIYEARPNVTVDAAGLGLKSRQRRHPARRQRRRRHQPRHRRRAACLPGTPGPARATPSASSRAATAPSAR